MLKMWNQTGRKRDSKRLWHIYDSREIPWSRHREYGVSPRRRFLANFQLFSLVESLRHLLMSQITCAKVCLVGKLTQWELAHWCIVTLFHFHLRESALSNIERRFAAARLWEFKKLNHASRHDKYFSSDMWCGSQHKVLCRSVEATIVVKKIIKLFHFSHKFRLMIALSILSAQSSNEMEYKIQKCFPGNSFDVLFMARLVVKGHSCMKVEQKNWNWQNY